MMRVRSKLKKVSSAPRVSVFRSLKHFYAQIIDDSAHVTMVSASTLDNEAQKGTKKEQARQVGLVLAKRAKEKGVDAVFLDRGCYKYHGRLKEFADGLREGGIAV